MIIIDSDSIESVAFVPIGNKYNGATLEKISPCMHISDLVRHDLGEYFLSRINFLEEYHFTHNMGCQYNKLFSLSRDFFSKNKSLIDVAANINNILFDTTKTGKIKEGLLFVVSFKNCIVEDQEVEALGIFKTETFDTFLMCDYMKGESRVSSMRGLSLRKLDKGCIIYNCKEDNGYMVNIYNSNRKADIQYWNEDFLGITIVDNDRQNANEIIKVCSKLLKSNIASDESSVKKIALLSELTSQIEDGEINLERLFDASNIDKESVLPIDIPNLIKVSKDNVKNPKAVIKLDNNFTISITGGDKYIKKGIDSTSGLHYYQFFYKAER